MPQTIVVVTHQRSGTHWVIDALRNNTPSISMDFVNLDELIPEGRFAYSVEQWDRALNAKSGLALVKTHTPGTLEPFQTDPNVRDYVDRLMQQSKILYVYRDGRDVLVSLYYYMQSYRKDLKTVSFSDFIRMKTESRVIPSVRDMNRVQLWVHHVESWLARPDIHPIAYEQMQTSYDASVQKMFAYLGLKLDHKPILVKLDSPQAPRTLMQRLLEKTPLARHSGVSSAVEPRKGVVGDWQNHFGTEDLVFFEQYAGALMSRLGYDLKPQSPA